MPSPKAIRVDTDEIISVDLMDRLTARPMTQGSVTVSFLNTDGTSVPGGSFSLQHDEAVPGTWRVLIPASFTSTLSAGKRYKIDLLAVSPTGAQLHAEIEIEAIKGRLD